MNKSTARWSKETSAASAILNTYHQLDDSPYTRSLIDEVHLLRAKYSDLERDYEHMVKQFKHLNR